MTTTRPDDAVAVLLDVLQCTACQTVTAPEDAGPPVYECGQCGSFVSDEGSRCPTCNKFARKDGDRSCPDCELPDLTEVQLWHLRSHGEDIYGETEEEAIAAALAYAADHTPEKEAERRASTDAVMERIQAARAEAVAAWEERMPAMREVMTAAGASASSLEWFTEDAFMLGSSSSISLDTPVWLAIVDLAKKGLDS